MELFARLLKQLMYAFAILLVMAIMWCFAGCKSSQKMTKESSSESKKDSSAFVQTAKLDTLQVPKETATASIPTKWLYDNPGTAYQASNGRATVSVKLVHDTVQVQAECDSLQKVIAIINTQLYHLQQQSTEKQSSEVIHTVKVPWQLQVIGWLIVAAVIGYVVLSVIKFIKPL
jgi:hypothetical protein